MNRTLLLLAALSPFFLAACLPSDPASDSTTITRQGAVQSWVEAVYDDQEDSIGTGFSIGWVLMRTDPADRASGAYVLNFSDHEDSLVMTYYLPGSAEAWAAISGTLDSLLALADSASMEEYFRLYDDYQQDYRAVKHYARQRCAFSAEGSVDLESEGDSLQVPVVFSSVIPISQQGLRFLIDHDKSGPPSGQAVGDFVGMSFSGTLTVTCPDPLL